MIAGFGLILILALIWGLSGNEISEENPFTDSPQHKNDLIYAPLIERGKVLKNWVIGLGRRLIRCMRTVILF